MSNGGGVPRAVSSGSGVSDERGRYLLLFTLSRISYLLSHSLSDLLFFLLLLLYLLFYLFFYPLRSTLLQSLHLSSHSHPHTHALDPYFSATKTSSRRPQRTRLPHCSFI